MTPRFHITKKQESSNDTSEVGEIMSIMFETEHLIIRSFRDEDAQKLYENHLDEEVKKRKHSEGFIPHRCPAS